MDVLHINRTVVIPQSELRFVFARSGGKGGQHVNKVETKVELLFDVAHSPSLTGDQKDLLAKHLQSRIDADGILHVVAQASRSQWKNREEAIEKFVLLVGKALRPRKHRIAATVPQAAKENRLQEKKRRSEVKRARRFTAD